MSRFGAAVKASGLKQTYLAEASGLRPETITRLKKGRRPRRSTAERLASVLRIPPNILFPGLDD